MKSTPETGNSPRQSGVRWLILGMTALVVAPVAMRLVPREISRWHLAAAQNARAAGDVDSSLRYLESAFAWDAGNDEALWQRAEWLSEDGDPKKALAAVDDVIARYPDHPALLQRRADFRLRAGDGRGAVEDMKRLEEMSRGREARVRAETLNGLAYYRALANLELEEGLADVELAIKLIGENEAMLDTRGFLHHRLGNDDKAMADMDAAVKLLQAGPVPDNPIVKRTIAVIRYHRALALDGVGRADEAETERQRVKELGFEPNDDLF